MISYIIMSTLIDLHNKLLKYNNNIIYIAFDDKTKEAWFQANHICKILKHSNSRMAIKINVEKQDKKPLDEIVKNYKTLYKNIQGHTIFINEAGLYSLIFSSKVKEAKEIRKWISHDVIPQIKKYGKYEIDEKHKTQIKELQNKYDEEVRKRKILEHDMKTVKYKKEGVIYLMRTITDDTDLELREDERIYMKFGETDDMNRRRKQLESTTPHKVQVINVIPCKNRKIVEDCIKVRLEKYIVRKRKDYIYCTYNEIIDEIAECIKFFDKIDIDKKMNLSRTKLDEDKKLEVVILNDGEFDKFKLINTQQGGDNEHFDEKEDYLKYLKYKIKYLELKYGFE